MDFSFMFLVDTIPMELLVLFGQLPKIKFETIIAYENPFCYFETTHDSFALLLYDNSN